MRMRKKKNLEERLENCSDNLIIIDNEDRNFNTAETYKNYIDIRKYFGNDNITMLEIGCGKGQFACEIAKRNPDINFIAVEKSANVIVAACEKAKKENIKNLLFIKCSAEYLNSYLRDNSISRIYLNFSCPFPKKKYACHRLTAQNFLKIYKLLMKPDAEIFVKTDNRGLFEFSIQQMSDFGMTIKNVSLDLHADDYPDNIVTEYESKFVSQGLPIYRLEAFFKKP